MKVLTNLAFWVLVALGLGVLVGVQMGHDAVMFQPLGDLFINLIKMLVVPLIAVSVLSGAASLGESSSAGKVGFSTVGVFLVTAVVSCLLALGLGGLFQPGGDVDTDALNHAMENSEDASQYDTNALRDSGEKETDLFSTVVRAFLNMIPTNIANAMATDSIIQVLVFFMFLGVALSRLPKSKTQPILTGVQTIMDALVWMIMKVMLLAPLGVFGLMAVSIGTFGVDLLLAVGKLFAVYCLGLVILTFGLYPMMVAFFSNVSVKDYIKQMTKPQIVAVSTASSMATLPVTMETVEKDLKCSNPVASFVLPLGATINMNGNAIYYALVAIFFAQIYGIELGAAEYVAIIMTSTLGAIGQAGVPGPSFLVVAVLLSAGIPIDLLPLLYATDRIFDMLRTGVNISGDAATALVVDKACGDGCRT